MKRKFVLLTTLLAFAFIGYGQNTLNENFEASSSLPSDWTFILDGVQEQANVLEVAIWNDDPNSNDYYSGRALSGENSAWILFQYCMDDNAKIYMISPKLKVTSANNSFVFNMFVDNFSPYAGKFSVLVSTSSNAKEDFNSASLLEVETADLFTGWEQYEVDLSTYNGQEIYVAIVFSDPGAYTWFFVDDITGPELAPQTTVNDTCKVTSLPFSENFDNWDYATVPDCWSWIGYDFYQGMYYPTTLVNGYNHTNWLAFLGIEGTETMVVSLPRLADNINVNTLNLNLDATNYGTGKLVVGVMNNPDSINTFIAVDTITPLNDVWTNYNVNFSEYIGTGKYISLRVGVPYDNDYVFVGVENLVLDYVSNPNATYDTILENICQGESFTFDGEELTESGVYFDTISVQENGMSEIQVLILSVNPSYTQTINDTIAEGETYTLNGFNESQSGQYTLALQTINGCDSIIVLNLTVETSSSVDEVTKESNFTIYPNPAKEKLFINTLEKNANVIITNINGTVVYQNNNFASTPIEINLKEFENGVYFIRINNLSTKKFIIEK